MYAALHCKPAVAALHCSPLLLYGLELSTQCTNHCDFKFCCSCNSNNDMQQEHNVNDVEVVKQLIEEANHRRSVGSTAANADSSRSHSIMQFALKRFIAGGAHSRLVGGWQNH